MEQIVATFENSKVYYHDKLKLGKIIWNGTPSKDEYRNPFKALLKFAETHPVEIFISDITQQGLISIENRKWFETQALPEAKALGLKRAAIVTNDNTFRLNYVSLILNITNKFNMPVKLFSSQLKAEKWLIENELLEV